MARKKVLQKPPTPMLAPAAPASLENLSSTTLTKIYPHVQAILARRRAEREEAERARENFRDFVKITWDTVEPAKRFMPNWHIDAIADHLQAAADLKIRKLLINIGPGYAKSIITSVQFPAWMWIRKTQDPTIGVYGGPLWRSLYSSYKDALAIRDSIRCRSLIESERYRVTFKPDWALSDEQNDKRNFENDKKGFRISMHVGAGTGFRGDMMACDDPLSASDQLSDAALDECIFWWDQTMSSRLNDMAKGVKVIIMQRLNERDLSGHVLNLGGYEHLLLPTEYDPGRSCVTVLGKVDPRIERGELLFPKLFPREVVDDIKAQLGSSGFEGQHQQNPSPVGGNILQKHWWRYWQPKGVDLPPVRVAMPNGEVEERKAITLPSSFDRTQQSWDCAFKETKDSDFVVGQVHAALGADRFLLDQVRDRMDFPKTLDAVRALTARWPNVHVKLVEDKANGPAVIATLKREIGGLIEVNPEGGKISRASAASPMVESGNWYLPHPRIAPWVDGFITECAAFPGAHDDQVDAWSQGAKRLLGVKAKPKPALFVQQPHATERSWMA